jgi:hypothetical protein
MDVRAEMNRELRRARGWLLAVGLIMTAFDLFMVFSKGDRLDPTLRAVELAITAAELGVFVFLWWLSKRKPRLGLTLGLVVYWGIQLMNAYYTANSLFAGIILKLLFTSALIKGIRSAGNVELMREELEKVFE